MKQVFCDPLLNTAAISPTVNPSDKFDEQKPVNDHESKKEIKSVGHRSLLSVDTKRDRATPVPL